MLFCLTTGKDKLGLIGVHSIGFVFTRLVQWNGEISCLSSTFHLANEPDRFVYVLCCRENFISQGCFLSLGTKRDYSLFHNCLLGLGGLFFVVGIVSELSWQWLLPLYGGRSKPVKQTHNEVTVCSTVARVRVKNLMDGYNHPHLNFSFSSASVSKEKCVETSRNWISLVELVNPVRHEGGALLSRKWQRQFPTERPVD